MFLGKKTRNMLLVVGVLAMEFFIILLARDVFLNGVHVYTLGAASPEMTTPETFFNPVRIILEVDSMSIVMAFITGLTVLVALMYSFTSMKEETGQDRFYFLMMLLTAGMMGIEMTGDIFNVFVFLEIASISAAALTGFRTRNRDSAEGGLKYMMVSAIAGLVILFAMGILYSQYNLLNIAALANAIKYTNLDKIALALFVMAWAMKMGAVPVHFWLPDSYSVAPTAITLMLMANTQAAVYSLFRVCFSLYNVSLNTVTVGWILIILGVLGMFVGVTMAVPQKDIKRLIAYNCVCESGFMLLGIGVGLTTLGNPAAMASFGLQAMTGAVFHMVNHVLFEGLLFLAAGVVFYRIGTRNLDEMGGLGHSMKYTAILFLIGALASAGLPPFNGFASKILIYESVYKFNPILAIVAVIVSIITLAIFVKAFFSAFAGQSLPEYKEVKDAPKPMMAAMLVLTVAIVLFGLFPGLVVNWMANPAAKALINQGTYIQSVLGGR